MTNRLASLSLTLCISLLAACGADDGGGEGEGQASVGGMAGAGQGVAGAGGASAGGAAGVAGAGQGDDEIEAVAFASTVQLDAASLAALEADDRSGRLRFSSMTPQVAALKKGSVIVAGKSDKAPRGLLRLVRSAKASGQGVEVDTVEAPLQLAFKKLHVKTSRKTPELGASGLSDVPRLPASLSDGPGYVTQGGGGDHVSKKVDVVVFDADDDTTTDNDQVRVQGELGGGFEYLLGIDVDWGDVIEVPEQVASCIESLLSGDSCSIKDLLPEVKVGFEVKGGLSSAVEVHGAALLSYERKVDVATVQLDPFAVGPLVFFPSIDVFATISGSASSSFRVGAKAGATFEAGVSYSSKSGGKKVAPTFDKTFEAGADDVTLQASSSAALTAELAVRLFDFAGPKAGFRVSTSLAADRAKTPCWSLSSGLDLTYGFVIGTELGSLGKVTLAEFSDSVPLATEELASGSCSLPPGGGPAVPGEGPTPETLSSPTFTPWSRAYTGALQGMAHTDLDGLYRVSMTRGIDGNLTLGTSTARALLKITPSGDVVWAQSYRDLAAHPADPPLTALGTVNLGDATQLVLTYPPAFIKIGQSGGVHLARGVELPETDDGGPGGDTHTQRTLLTAVADGEGGAWLSATREPAGLGRTEALLLHVGVDGSLLSSLAFRDSERHLYPTVLVRTDDGLFVAGSAYKQGGAPTFEGFALRLGDDQKVRWARRFSGCADADEVLPAAGLRHSSGDLVLAGRQGFYNRSFALRLSANGELVSSSYTRPEESLSYMVITAIAELPTTGFVVAGRYVDRYEPTDLFMGSLDASLKMTAATHYRQAKVAGDTSAEQSLAAMVLGDDGGATIAGASSAYFDSAGSYWALKPRLKDRSIELPVGATATAAPVLDQACALAITPFDVSAQPAGVTVTTLEVKSEPVTVTPR